MHDGESLSQDETQEIKNAYEEIKKDPDFNESDIYNLERAAKIKVAIYKDGEDWQKESTVKELNFIQKLIKIFGLRG